MGQNLDNIGGMGIEAARFEYNIEEDVMNFSRNINKYIPCPTKIDSFSESMEISGKVLGEDVKRALSFFRPVKSYGDVSRSEVFRCLDFDGNYRWFRIEGKDIPNDEGKPSLIYGTYVLLDDSEGMTGINMRVDSFTGLDSVMEAEKKIRESFAEDMDVAMRTLYIIKLSAYQNIKENNGIDEAEELLLLASRALKSAVRTSDVVGRMNEDSFIYSIRGINEENIIADKADFIIEAIEGAWKETHPDTKKTVSVGIALASQAEAVEYAEMMKKAEDALAKAEKSENSTFVIYGKEIRSKVEMQDGGSSYGNMESIRSILDPIVTWAYAVDEDYNVVYMNDVLKDRFPNVSEGICYEKLKGRNTPCDDCPMKLMPENENWADFDVYSPDLRAMEHVRATRVLLKNKRKVYVMADVNEELKIQMQELDKSINHFNSAILEAHDIVWEINLTKNRCTRVREENIPLIMEKRVVSYSKLRNAALEKLVYYEDREYFMMATDPEAIRKAGEIGKKSIHKQIRFNGEDGVTRWYEIDTTIIDSEDDELVFFTARDINDMKLEMEQQTAVELRYKAMNESSAFMSEIAQNNERYEHVNELTGIFVFEYDVSKAEYYICTTFEEMFKLTDDMKKNEWSMLEGLEVYEEDKDTFEEFFNRVKSQPDTHEITVRLMNRYGVARWFTITVQTLNGFNNELYRVTGIIQDVNAEMEIKAELEFRADYDSLTRLYNSDAFYRKAQERIHGEPDKEFAVLSIDIDRFRVINDRFGIKIGNKCLEELGNAIRVTLPKDCIAGRYMADNYSVLLDYENERDIFEYIDLLTREFVFDAARRCGSTLSFGIYKITKRDLPIRLMCDRARMAKQEIKNNSITNFAIYDDKVRLQQRKISEITSQMQVALDNREFVMFLQPKVDMKDEHLCGAEALVRWIHPTKGVHSPGEFIPLFESNGFVKKLDEYMWEAACEYLSHLKSIGKLVPISVNISRFHVNNTDLVKVLTDMTSRYGIEPQYLELEITETLFTDNSEDLYATMQRLKDLGFVIEMDDFGSGYSSLNMLRKAPVDIIKIDRYFIDKIMSTKRGRIIIENSVSMSRQLGLKVVAEGVETKEQADFLKSINCDIAQGYYYSKPVSIDEFENMLGV
ncbi:MAG: EAL domain-containing protein [Lachnospiraceae bacterium]|nr:EAL domain-containing protein [Lachnospiraceae bacterium]